ncbi:DUF3224 domain-containing protein [Amycolatopsis cihanbeyliensis]|uniref:Uncharacterized protein DUF3224 n=1 Tax=Amycolatopsis cihanbeyliensis TaxID=1128664 RepID=A0A542DP69_AMYCI|nr:DUF3224 domain-containing protein [Amycolatopsis cihanbeyliensis]TQJ04903.1 uncharacterized protein DUF3224 [Amycolatopsis cihanbeyliensis]
MSENTFTMRSWDERVVSGEEGEPRFAHAHATFTYTGVIEGSSACDYLMYYAGEGFAGDGQTAPGFERIEGSVDGREGSFVVRHTVRYGASGVEGTWTVVPGSGTGELAGLGGSGTIAGASEIMDYTFDYSFSRE